MPGGTSPRRSLPDPELLRGRQERKNQNPQDALGPFWNFSKHLTNARDAHPRKAPTQHQELPACAETHRNDVTDPLSSIFPNHKIGHGMDKVRFEAELIEGHKGVTVVLVPFDPEERWL